MVGGTRQVGSYDTNVSEEDKKETWERACQLLPSLRVSKKANDQSSKSSIGNFT